MYVTQLKLIIFSLIIARHLSWGIECPAGFIDCLNDKCVKSSWVCDREDDCGNGEDEKGCKYEPDQPAENCGPKEMRCENSTECIPIHYKCDGEDDCPCGSEEKQCNETVCEYIRCGKLCLFEEWICDGEEDCDDGSDEKNCFDANSCENMNCSQSCDSSGNKAVCYCDDGYEVDENDPKSCIDIDECQFNGTCSHECVNTIGSFICICSYAYEPIKRDCKARGADPLLIFSTKNETRSFNLRSNQSTIIRSVETRMADVDLDPNDERIYGFESSGTRTMFSVKIDGTDYKKVDISSLREPKSLAVDYIAHNIYVADERLSQIFACKLYATWCVVLHDEKDHKPHSIVLDIAEGYMFWSGIGEKSSGIFQSGMDGSSPLHLVSNDTVMPTGLALDHTTKRIYWTDAKLSTIESSDFSGGSRQILSRTRLRNPLSLVLFEDYLFWSNTLLSSVESCNKFACHRRTVIPRKTGQHIRGVRIYHPSLKQNISNPCLLSNCSQICLMSPGNSFRCVCSSGYKLSSDQKTCLKFVSCPDDELLCPLTNRCMSRDLICDGKADCPDKIDEKNCTKSRREAVTPSGIEENEIISVSDGSSILVREKSGLKESSEWNFILPSAMISGLAYDSTMKRLFVADLKTPTIYVYNLTSQQRDILVANRLISPEDIAFDWMSNNLYWVDSVKGTVEVASVFNRKRVIILEDLERPVALALSSLSGNMFVSTTGDEGYVTMYGMDGKNKKILNVVQGLPMSLALHPSKSILYWTDSSAGMIFYFNYTGSRSPWILKSGINGLMSVAVTDDNVYWTAGDEPVQSEIAGGVYVQKLPGSQKDKHWRRIIYSSGKSITGKSECLIRNGGCSYLCLTSQTGRTCACSSAMTLANNGKFCYGKKCKEGDFKCKGGQCIPGEMECDGSIDCNDGSDERNCPKHTSEVVKANKTLIHELLKLEVDLVSLPLFQNATEGEEHV